MAKRKPKKTAAKKSTKKAVSKKTVKPSKQSKQSQSKKTSALSPTRRKRRTIEEMCNDLRRDRNKLYAQRRKYIDTLSRKNLSADVRKETDSKWKSVQKKIETIKDKLFKCGKKYGRLKEQRVSLRKHQHYLSKKIKEGRAAGMSNTQINRIGIEERKTIEALNSVERAMQLPIAILASGKGQALIKSLRQGRFVEQEPIWRLADRFQELLNSAYFETLVLDDDIYDMAALPIVAIAAVYQAVDWAMAWQHIYGTPFYFMFGDANAGYLEIKVKQFTTDLYYKEIEKHGKENISSNSDS
ncbi:MAG TPA: hypothetical protein VMW25_04865 [Clostridia bacterium]|nr:hypothetical protein [Clostridia bacterium]